MGGRAGLFLHHADGSGLDDVLRACGLAPAYVSASENAWTAIYPLSFETDSETSLELAASALSRALGVRVVGVWLHRAFAYVLADRGAVIDCHGFPNGGSGHAEKLLSFCLPGTQRGSVESLLRFHAPPAPTGPVFDSAQKKALEAFQSQLFAGKNVPADLFANLEASMSAAQSRAAAHDVDSDIAEKLSKVLGVKKERLLLRAELLGYGGEGLRLVRVMVPEPSGLPALRSWDGSITEILVQLDARLGTRLERLEPGLPDTGIRELEQLLFPFSLPEDWRAFYRWRNGTLAEQIELPQGAHLYSLEAALEQRKFYIEKLDWNPMWLPIADGAGGTNCVFATSLHQGQFQPTFIWELWFEDGHFVLRHESLAKMLACGLDQLERVPAEDVVGYEDWNDRVEALRLFHSPSADVADQEPPCWPRRIHVMEDRSWPAAWQRAIGRASESYRSSGATTTIAEIQGKGGLGNRGTIEARIVFLIGRMDEAAIRVEDGTGDLWLHCKGDAHRDVRLNALCEIDVRAIEYTRALDTDLYYRATRLLRLEVDIDE